MSRADGPVLLIEDLGPVRRLTLNRPASLNALNDDLMDALEAVRRAAEDDDGRVVVPEAPGERSAPGTTSTRTRRKGRRTRRSGTGSLTATRGGSCGSSSSRSLSSRRCTRTACGRDRPDARVRSRGRADDAVFGYVDIRFGSGVVSMFLPWVVGVRAAKEPS